MRILLSSALCCALCVPVLAGSSFDPAAVAATQPIPSSSVSSLDGTWSFQYLPTPSASSASSVPSASSASSAPSASSAGGVSAALPISVPGCWELQGFAPPEYAKALKDGTGIYSRSFTVPATWSKADRVFICFEGVCFGFSFTVNGKPAGAFDSAFNRSVFDVSDLVDRSGTNSLVVTVITKPRCWSFDVNDDWSLSGIVRPVYLFALPPTHIQDVRVVTKMDGSVAVDVAFQGPDAATASFTSELRDASGKVVATGSTALKVPNPELWSAEHPYLYTLDIKTPFQSFTQKIGIREISWQDGVFKINGRPVMLKGANHHDLDPIHGRAITRDFMLKDLKLMKDANLNFIRLSHYPPNPEFLDLCDELGFYVADEVPFGFGDGCLKQEAKDSFVPDTRKRAWFTIHRDKNRPCVVIWTVGNEDPVCPTLLQAGKYVGELDPTRPWCFPFTPGNFRTAFTNAAYASAVPIWDVHYLADNEFAEYAAQATNKVFVQTEFAHALGLDFGEVETAWELMTRTPNMAGGAVWEFIDQGLLRTLGQEGALKRAEKRNAPVFYCWRDASNYYDTAKFGGTDGVVYADRTPQVDYYQLRKVYAPVRVALADSNTAFRIENRYDFTDLSAVKAQWSLFADSQQLAAGDLPLAVAPHAAATIPFPAPLVAALSGSAEPSQGSAKASRRAPSSSGALYIRLTFTDRSGLQISENSLVLSRPAASSRLSTLAPVGPAVPSGPQASALSSSASSATSAPSAGGVSAALPLPLLFRTGRKATLCELDMARRNRNLFFWSQKILSPSASSASNSPSLGAPSVANSPSPSAPLGQCEGACPAHAPSVANSPSPGAPLGQREGPYLAPIFPCDAYHSVTGLVSVTATNGASILDYDLTMCNKYTGKSKDKKARNQGRGITIEAGLAFRLPPGIKTFRWLGDGPYAAYPQRSLAAEYGVWALSVDDLYFPGNRRHVDLALFTDRAGAGYLLVLDQADLAVERQEGGLVVGINSVVGSPFNKARMAHGAKETNGLKISGTVTIIPVSSNWSSSLRDLFGDPSVQPKPFVPFTNSYDQ